MSVRERVCECVCVHRDGQHFTVLQGMYINQCITLTDNYVYFLSWLFIV